MSWQGFDILLDKYPQLRGDIEKLQKYVKDTDLKTEEILDLSHASAITSIQENKLREILERGTRLGIFEKVFKLKCSKRGGFVSEKETPFSFPLETFCDLCGCEHSFYEEDVFEGYRLKFVLSFKDLDEIRNSMPVLGYFSVKLAEKFKDSPPFLNKAFLIAPHFVKDLIVFLEAFENLGLEANISYVFYKPYFYPHKNLIISRLKSKGYNVFPIEKLEEILSYLNESELVESIVVVEDGGYITPLLHRFFKNLLIKTTGAVEQTTRGIRNDEKLENIEIPVLNVAESDIKTKIEPPHVADAVVKNLENLLFFEKFRGRKAALLGYGTIGKEIAERLKNKGMNITVYDPDPERRVEAKEKGYEVMSETYNTVKDKFLVIGCSGETSIGRNEILNLGSHTYLVSASSDQKEIGVFELDALSSRKELLKHDEKIIGTTYFIRGQKDKPVHLLADGYPVNFWFSESMPDQFTDLILSLIFLSALEVVQYKERFSKGIQSVDEIAKIYKLTKVYEEYY